MDDKKLEYRGSLFKGPLLKLHTYCDDYFWDEIELESELFYELRKNNHIEPSRLIDSPPQDLENIRMFFKQHQNTFRFLYLDMKLVGSVLWIDNYIQSLCVRPSFQRKGIGSKLTQYAVNEILGNGFDFVTLNVLPGNRAALQMYTKLGFHQKS